MSLQVFLSFHIQIFLLSFILFILLLDVRTVQSASGGNETDRLALLAIKSKILHDPQGIVASWNESFHFCEWQGIRCGQRHKRVTIIDLMSKGLIGSLSPHIGNMSFLQRIRLSNNTFQGPIPQELGNLFRLQVLVLDNNTFEGEIPKNLSHCHNLIGIGLGFNNLVGKIPLEFSSLVKLKTLDFHFNNIIGGVPHFIGNFTELQTLSAGGNSLGGKLPNSLGELKGLIFLGLGGNNISGTIPPPLYNLSLATYFSLAGNQLHGILPSDIGFSLPSLQVLQLWGNHLSGPIPVSLSNASNLYYIEMHGNNFTGKILVKFGGLKFLNGLALASNNLGNGEPGDMNFLSSLVNCSNLRLLDLNSNNLGGVLPSSIGNLSNEIDIIHLASNKISGNIPREIGNLVNLIFLALDGNQFTGSIPTEIVYLQKMQRLSLCNNKLSGKIPSSLGTLSMLNELHLENNRLEGSIPPSLGNCQLLVLLNLSQNNLTGHIPNQLFGASALSITLNLARNHLVGSLPSEIGSLKTLVELDLSENELSGEIPSTLGSCTGLQNLYFEGNFFQKTIPSSLGSLRGIQTIDLSRNNLSGQVPMFLGDLNLTRLNLSFNNFEGEVPMKGVFSNTSALSVVGNTRLCGGVDELKLPKCNLDKRKKHKMTLVPLILILLACGLLGVAMVIFIFFYCRKRKRKAQSSESSMAKPLLKVSYESLLKATDEFSSRNLVGVGSFGSVYKGILDENEAIIAVKVLNLQRKGASKSFMSECEALRNIRHRNLVKIITSCSSIDFKGNDFKALVYEFMPNGSLESWLHSTEDEPRILNLHERINIAIDIATAIDYLHHHCGNPIIHCDLKPSNVLLDSDMVGHVGDFGLSKFLPELLIPSQSSSIGVRGTIGYAAPEYGMGSEVSTNRDVYSYGILLLEMTIGKRPTDPMFQEGLNLHNLARKAFPDSVMEILEPSLPKNDEKAAKAMNEMVRIGVACSMESPHDRMGMSNVIHDLVLVRDNFQGT